MKKCTIFFISQKIIRKNIIQEIKNTKQRLTKLKNNSHALPKQKNTIQLR